MEIIGSFTVNPFPVAAVEPLSISNRQLADDFIDLTMELETGTSLPVFTRFEGPISVRLQGAVPAPLPSELNDYWPDFGLRQILTFTKPKPQRRI